MPQTWKISDFIGFTISKDAWKECIFLPLFPIFGKADLEL